MSTNWETQSMYLYYNMYKGQIHFNRYLITSEIKIQLRIFPKPRGSIYFHLSFTTNED